VMRVSAALYQGGLACGGPRGRVTHGRSRTDIQPTDREFILMALHLAFPRTTVTVHPRPASIATLFRVREDAVLRHQLLVPRILDDARATRTRLATLMADAVAEMRRVGSEVILLGAER
jgi:hypothetical protein